MLKIKISSFQIFETFLFFQGLMNNYGFTTVFKNESFPIYDILKFRSKSFKNRKEAI